MSMIEVEKTLDGMQESGVIIVGREHIEGLLSNDDRGPTEVIPVLMATGRARGIHFYQDQAQFDGFELARKLGEVGFDREAARAVIANLRPVPTPELMSLGDRD